MRYLKDYIESDLNHNKMVLLAGPRQVGKTTFSFCFLPNIESYSVKEDHPAYLNWDIPSKRKIILSDTLPQGEMVILDEIHKHKLWRNYLKGLYDLHKSRIKVLVTGSAKLDYYRRGGDSLQGRYFFYRLHPLSPGEIKDFKRLDQLLEFGGFPEPYYQADRIFWQRWQNLRQKRLIEEDLIYLENIKDLSQIEILMDLIPERVGSLLSLNSLREDLHCSHDAVKNWMLILENLYYHFRITPFNTNRLHAIKKEPKIFLWDWSIVEQKGPRFENFIASMLLKYCHLREDAFGEKLTLHFFRAKDRREIDFIVCRSQKPIFAVECKTNNTDIAKSFLSLRPHFKDIPFYQVHSHASEDRFVHQKSGIEVIPAMAFLSDVLEL